MLTWIFLLAHGVRSACQSIQPPDEPVAAFHTPLVPVAAHVVAPGTPW